MTAKYDVAVLVGSLRADSFNRKVVDALAPLSTGLSFRIVDFHDLPMMNEDIEATPPDAWLRFREEIRHADAFLFATPEYNRSIPGALKNALDVGSRPYGSNFWNDRPAAVISASIATTGGFGANHHLRQVLTYLNVHVMAQPEVYVPHVAALVGAEGQITDARTLGFLQTVADAFQAWVERHHARPTGPA